MGDIIAFPVRDTQLQKFEGAIASLTTAVANQAGESLQPAASVASIVEALRDEARYWRSVAEEAQNHIDRRNEAIAEHIDRRRAEINEEIEEITARRKARLSCSDVIEELLREVETGYAEGSAPAPPRPLR